MVQADHRAFDDAAAAQRAHGGEVVVGHLVAALVQHLPAAVAHRLRQRLARAQAEDAHRRRVAVHEAALRVLDDDALVDRLHQLAVADFRLLPLAQVAGHRDDRVAPVVGEVRRMHLDREAGPVRAHVGDFDDVGAAAVQGFQHRRQVVARQVRVEHLDRLADDVLARAVVGLHAGAVEVQHGAVAGDDADRVRHRVEQRAVLVVLGGDRLACLQQRGAHVVHHAPAMLRELGVAAGLLERRQGLVDPLDRPAPRGRLGAHAASARPTLLPVSRPSRPASQRPVSASRGRSTPVRMPSPCSM